MYGSKRHRAGKRDIGEKYARTRTWCLRRENAEEKAGETSSGRVAWNSLIVSLRNQMLYTHVYTHLWLYTWLGVCLCLCYTYTNICIYVYIYIYKLYDAVCTVAGAWLTLEAKGEKAKTSCGWWSHHTRPAWQPLVSASHPQLRHCQQWQERGVRWNKYALNTYYVLNRAHTLPYMITGSWIGKVPVRHCL